MKYIIRALAVFAIGGLAFATLPERPTDELTALKSAMDSISVRPVLASSQELRTSTPGVTYVLKQDGSVEFHVPADFVGVAITPDGRNLFLAN